MRVTAKHLILDLLMAAGPEPLSVRHLLASGALFGVPANNLRVTLARLGAEGLIESVGRGLYRLSAGAHVLADDVSTWRTACDRVLPWHGGYVTVHCGALGRSDRVALRRRDRALQLLGMRELDRGLFVRPDNLEGGVEQVRQRLLTLGVERDAAIFHGAQFDAEREQRLHALWDGAALTATYQQLQAQLTEWKARAHLLSIDDAARESYLLGSKAIRHVVFDPLLPEPLVDVGAREAFVQAVLAFDRFGHEIWRQFHAEALRATPAHTASLPATGGQPPLTH